MPAPPRAGGAALPDAGLLAALLALALHLPGLGNGFVRDDLPLILENPWLRGPDGLPRLLTGDFLAPLGYHSGLWRPLPLLSFWLEGRLGGWQPVLFHAVSILLHAGCALLLGRLLGLAGLPWLATLLGAAWFAAMPAHVEPVAWVSGRTDLLCGSFALLALWLDRRARAAGRRGPGWGAPLALAGALLSKESAGGWLAVVLAAEWVRARRTATPLREVARWVAPYAAVTVLWLAAHTAAAGGGALPPWLDEARRARRHAAGWTLLPQYLAFLWPGYPHASDVAVALPARPFTPGVLAGAGMTLAAFAGALALTLRGSRFAVPSVLGLVPLAPAIVVAVGRGFVSSGERMMFLPSAGVAWLAAEALAAAPRSRAGRLASLAAMGLVVASAVTTVRLLPTWRDDASVFAHLTREHPGNPVGWVGLAETRSLAGDAAGAELALARAAELDPTLPSVPMALAEHHYRAGAWEAVAGHAGRALALDPTLYRARLLRASTRIRLGRPSEAAGDVTWLLERRPDDPSALMVAAQMRLAEGRPEAAVPLLEAATRRNPDDPGPWATLGHARAAAGDLAAARAALERALRIDPRSARVWRRLAGVHAAMGDSAAAGAALARANAAEAAAPR